MEGWRHERRTRPGQRRPRGSRVLEGVAQVTATWRCNACGAERTMPAIVGGTDIRHTMPEHYGCPEKGRLIPVQRPGASVSHHRAEWDAPLWGETSRDLGIRLSEESAVRLGFASLAEAHYCIGMHPEVATAWWRGARIFLEAGSPATGLLKASLLKLSPRLRGLWAAGKITSVGLQEMQRGLRGDLAVEKAALSEQLTRLS